MTIRPNIYRSLTNICMACGFPVIGKRGGERHTCSLEPKEGNPKRSECQMYADKFRQQEARTKLKAEDKKRPNTIPKENVNVKLRECLGRLCLDEPDRLFWSKSVHNRQCSRCSGVNQMEGIPIRDLRFKGGVVEHGVVRTFVPGQISRSRNKD